MTWSAVSRIFGFGAALAGAFLLYRVLSRHDLVEIVAALDRLTIGDLLLAGLFTLASFTALTAGEILATRYAGRKLSAARIGKTTVAAIGVGHALGMAALSSGAIRYRMYGRSGMELRDLGRIMLFSGLTVASGIAVVGGLSMLFAPARIGALLGMEHGEVRLIGGGLLALVAIYAGLCALQPGEIRIARTRLSLPRFPLALGQMAAGTANYAAIAGCLYACLRAFADADYPTVAALYVGADATAVIGHVPGGWGVLEYVLTAALAQPQLIAGILVFRTVYYLVPLFVGMAVFAQDEIAALHSKEQPEPATGQRRAATGLQR